MGLFKKKNKDVPSPAEEKKERDETAEIRSEIERFISKMDEINFDKIYKKTNFAVIPESELTTVYFPRIAKLRDEAHNISASTVESLGVRDIIDDMIKLAEILNIALAASSKRPIDISMDGIKYCMTVGCKILEHFEEADKESIIENRLLKAGNYYNLAYLANLVEKDKVKYSKLESQFQELSEQYNERFTTWKNIQQTDSFDKIMKEIKNTPPGKELSKEAHDLQAFRKDLVKKGKALQQKQDQLYLLRDSIKVHEDQVDHSLNSLDEYNYKISTNMLEELQKLDNAFNSQALEMKIMGEQLENMQESAQKMLHEIAAVDPNEISKTSNQMKHLVDPDAYAGNTIEKLNAEYELKKMVEEEDQDSNENENTESHKETLAN